MATTDPTESSARPLRIAVLLKQIPRFEAMELGPDGRLVRDGLELEMNAYCRRAVSKGVELAADTGGSCVAFTLGPPTAEDALREAVAWGADEGVLITDPAFAGSDTLATARALAAAIEREGPFDLVLLGRNSVDADTGQVPPQLAQLLDLPFLTGVRRLAIADRQVEARCEHDDEWVDARLALPAVLSVAERLCDPSKKPPEDRAAVTPGRIRTLRAADLGPGPWGQAGSPTAVGEVKVVDVERLCLRLEGPLDEQVARAVELLVERGALIGDESVARPATVQMPIDGPSPGIGVILEPDRAGVTRELLGAAAELAQVIGARVVALGATPEPRDRLGAWGADAIVELVGAHVEEDVASGVRSWADEVVPWAILAPGTAWGREVASRTAAAMGVGLTGDAVSLEVCDGRLLAWKPAFGGRTVAAIRSSSAIQMATVRAGVLPVLDEREAPVPPVSVRRATPRGRVTVENRWRDDDMDVLASATHVIGVGQGIDPADYDRLAPLQDLLGAELAATRKVTDKGWMPRARQVGITGHSIAPRLFVSIGASGKFNHTVGVRLAGTILAINPDPDALVWDCSDIGIVGPWEDVVPLLEAKLAEVL